MLTASRDSRYCNDFELDEKTFDQEAIQRLQEDSGFTLPAGARGLNYAYHAPMDPGFAAKFEVPATSKEEVANRILQMRNDEMHVSGAFGPRFPWWAQPKDKVLCARFQNNERTSLHAILTEEQDRIFLYLNWEVK